jgi:RNA polymerase sigma-70 factor, ECF subfamily
MKDKTDTFEEHRAHLTSIAYRMLGEMAGAEDVVQEAWLRWQRADSDGVRDPRAWLSAATIRLSLDALRAARARRETYVGPWLPEPLLPDDMRAMNAPPDATAELASDLSMALMHVLERLSPEERAALILHDAFDCDYPEIAATLGKNEATCRKLVSRARERVRHDRPRFTVSKERHRAVMEHFLEASASHDPAKLLPLFADDVVFYSDGGGRVPAALNPVRGADHVSRLIAGLLRKFLALGETNVQLAEINGRPGCVFILDHAPDTAVTLETDGERITAIYAVRNPVKLARLNARTLALRTTSIAFPANISPSPVKNRDGQSS